LAAECLCINEEETEGWNNESDPDLTNCFEILRDARVRLDQIATKPKRSRKSEDMFNPENNVTNKLKRELESCEKQYIVLARMNPQSVNDTQNHMVSIEKLARDMRRIRKRLCWSTDSDHFLKELLYPPSRTDASATQQS
jgi:hypothetical protein